MCDSAYCANAGCAFGGAAEYARVLGAVAAKTGNCSEPPAGCDLYLERYARAGVHGTCGVNERVRQWVVRACGVGDATLACVSTATGSSGYLVGLLGLLLMFLTVRALKRRAVRLK